TGFVSFFVGLILGAKMYKKREQLEKWSKNKLQVVGVPLE
ncbi:unnamed protein product, partial [marine sediment metagenome]